MNISSATTLPIMRFALIFQCVAISDIYFFAKRRKRISASRTRKVNANNHFRYNTPGLCISCSAHQTPNTIRKFRNPTYPRPYSSSGISRIEYKNGILQPHNAQEQYQLCLYFVFFILHFCFFFCNSFVVISLRPLLLLLNFFFCCCCFHCGSHVIYGYSYCMHYTLMARRHYRIVFKFILWVCLE